MKIILIIATLFISFYSFAQKKQAVKMVQAGNDLYKQQQFDQAASEYSKALEADPADNTAKFNLANTLYKQEKQDEAAKFFSEVASAAGEPGLKAKAFYNKGVILSKQKKLEESIEAYKSSLRLNPDDKEARENLQKALLELKKKNPPKKKEEKNNKKKQEQQQQQKQQQSKMSPKEAEQKLKLLEQKEKEVQQRLQQQKAKTGGSQTKDW
jgi:Ca-activated chloride channel family protein